jgi:5-methylcytosine-specific restriction endonuclease McrA
MTKKKRSNPILSTSDKRFKTTLISVLRRFSRFWEPSSIVLKRARIARGMYQCTACSKIVGAKEIKIDHIEPVVPVTGFTNWDDLIGRLFCEESGLQAICKSCHDNKTKEENEKRKRWRKEQAVIKYFKEKGEKKSE